MLVWLIIHENIEFSQIELYVNKNAVITAQCYQRWLKSSKMAKKLDKIEILALIFEKWKSHLMWTEKCLDVLGWSTKFSLRKAVKCEVNSENGKLENYIYKNQNGKLETAPIKKPKPLFNSK